MAASPSASSVGANFAVWLYDSTGKNRVALVDVPVPLPALVSYLGLNYVWSNINWVYEQTSAFIANTDAGQPVLSVLANPQF